MRCVYCNCRCNFYDGGEAANYELALMVCEECGETQPEYEVCPLCEGSAYHDGIECAYCAGEGRVEV